MEFKEKVLNKEVKLYPIGEDGYRIYGKTFEIKDELKELGAVWNEERKAFEISKKNFSKLPQNVREMIIKIILQSKVESVKVVSELIISEKIKLYVKDGNYRVYGKTKKIYKDLLNVGFKFIDGKYQLSVDSFNAVFKTDVKEKVNEVPQISSEELEG